LRDKRFIAEHRAGSLSSAEHHDLALWASDCAEHVLPYYNGHSADDRPHRAIKLARSWANGQLSVGGARDAAFGAHDAARNVTNKSASAAARSAGHAVATAHMADHSLQAAKYALKAVKEAGGSVEAEQVWQNEQLPNSVRELVLSALNHPFNGLLLPKSSI
jgi:hypothetical protein